MEIHRVLFLLRHLRPNTSRNLRFPWKGECRTYRAWCPLHQDQWVRLLISHGESNESVIRCEGGCTQTQVEDFLLTAGRVFDVIAGLSQP